MSLNAPLWNDTVVPGNRMTHMPLNLFAWQALPDHTIRNWGDMTSYTTYNRPAMTPLESFLARNILSPNHISQWDPMLITLGCPQMNQGTSPILTQIGLNAASNMGNYYREKYNEIRLNNAVKNIASALSSLENSVVNILKNENLKPSHKAKFEKLLEKIRAKKKEIENKLKDKPSMEELEAIQGEIINLQKEISDTTEKIKTEIENKKSEKADKSDKSNKTDTSSDINVSDEAAKKAEEKQKKRLDTSANICKDMYMATIGNSDWLGRSDKTKLKTAASKITKDTVAITILNWDKQYASCGKSMIKAIFDGERGWNGAESLKIITEIVNKLESKAKELGIYNDLIGQFTVAYDELDDTFVNEGKVDTAISTIAQAVYEKQIEVDQQNIQKEMDKKAEKDTNKEKANTVKKAKAEFLSDMREIWKDNSLEISDKVKYEDGEFTIRINGKNYYGSDFNELAESLKDAGFDPKEYLGKKKVNK